MTGVEHLLGSSASRLAQARRLLRALIARQPRLFAIAVTGAAVFALCTVASSAALRWVIDHVIVPRFEDGSPGVGTVAAGLALVVGVGALRALAVIVRRTWAVKAQYRIAESISDDVVERIAEQPVPWHRRQSAGELVARTGVDVDAAIAVLAPTPFATGVVLLVVVAAGWLLVTDWVLGLAAVAVFPLLLVVNVGYQRRVDRHFESAQHELGALSSAVHESVEGVTVVKAFGAEERETHRLAVIAGRLRDARVSALRLRSTFEALLDGLPNVVNIALVVGGAYRVRSGDMTVGEVSSFVYLFTLLVFPLRLIGYALSELPHSQAGWDKVRAVLEEPLAPDPVAQLEASSTGGVVLRDVHVAHEGDREVLVGVDAAVAPGTTVAVVGPTGAGKTTLLHAMAGLVPVRSGRIELPPGPRALVLQEPFLLAADVRENVTLGASADDPEVWEALELAEAADFVRDLPDGLDTPVGERGVGLSGGQRQRIALARALLRRPSVLLLDDTTSALDPSTEMRVIAHLRDALSGTTVFAVASRPSTIALADEVLYLLDGRIVAHGRHEDLMVRVPGYRDLIAAFEHDRSVLDDAAANGGAP